MVNGGVLISQDLSCAGQVSLAVALPILGACGLKPTVLPTEILSTHTGFSNNTYYDLNDEMAKILQHWQEIDLEFNALYLGYLGKHAIDFWLDKIDQIKHEKEIFLLDPAMADHGKLYRNLDSEYVIKMRQLVPKATILTPNMTEAAFLLDEEIPAPSIENATDLARKLVDRFDVANIVITGINLTNEKIAEVGITEQKEWALVQKKLPGSFFGTGDMFASSLLVAYLHDNELEKSCSIAADFVERAIINTPIQDKRLGPNYAAGMMELLKEIKKDGNE